MTSTSTTSPGTNENSDPAAKAKNEMAKATQAGKDAAAEVAESQYGRGRDEAAERIDSASATLSDVASTLEDRDSPFASYATELSDQLSSFSDKVSTSSMDEMISGARSLARSNPAAFMLGSVAIGLAASRFFKATGEQVTLDSKGLPASDTRDQQSSFGQSAYQNNDRGTTTSFGASMSGDSNSRSTDSVLTSNSSAADRVSTAGGMQSETMTNNSSLEPMTSGSKEKSTSALPKRESNPKGVV